MKVLETYVIVFVASFCTMAIEIVAGRMLAPYVGVSIYTWTSIIGVILAGISLGAYIGGRLADRFPKRKTLDLILLISGIMALTIVPLADRVASYPFPFPLMLSILLVTFIIFFIPGCLLGTISPVVVKLALTNLKQAGSTIGAIYAVSTFGAIAGTFITGFFLIGSIGTRMVVFSMSLLLILTAVLSGRRFSSWKLLILFLVVAIPSLGALYKYVYSILPVGPAFFYKESAYYTITLEKRTSVDEKTPLVFMILDRLIHSEVCPSDPLHLEYEYERVYADVLKWKYKKDTSFKSLSIGGGGYAFPRYLEVYYRDAQIDVVEIDPEVTRVAYRLHGIDRKRTRITTYNTDGRWFVMNCREKYDLILIDAFNDLSIPYHLTTKEFAQQIKDILNPGGIVMTNIIDNFQKGAFLPSYVRTLREIFGQNNVHLLSVEPDFRNTKINTFIVLAGNGKVDIEDFGNQIKRTPKGGTTSSLVPEALVHDMISSRRSIVITDDHAPVDNLIAPVFNERFSYGRND